MRLSTKYIAGLALCLAAARVPAPAQSNTALIDMLVRKGILTDQEAKDLQAELARETQAKPEAAPAAPAVQTAKSKVLERVTINGRIQAQYAGISTDIGGTAEDPASTQHLFLRRVRLGVRAQLTQGVTGYINYDFGSTSFDAATITWRQNENLAWDLGLRKAPIGYEEFLVSSASIKPIERSGVTRYFMETNNGRRLGAGKYRQGLWMVGGNARQGFSYQIALTNPEGIDSASGAISAGNASNNGIAAWAHGAYTGSFEGGSYKVGGSVGLLPGQGGRTPATTGATSHDVTVGNVFADLALGSFSLAGEYYTARVENGAGSGATLRPRGFYVQPSYRFGDYEAVLRYGQVDSDGRGINLSDAVRSAPGGGTMDRLAEMYAGGGWYIRGNDLKLSLGLVWGRTKDTVAGAPAQATSRGVRSQLQLNF